MGKPNPKPRDRINKAGHSMNPDRPKTSSTMRDRTTIRRLQMYRNFKPKRDKTGKIVKAAPFQSTLKSGTMARVEPNRKWFGNTRVVTQNALQSFNEALNKVKADPYKVVMSSTKNPVTLLSYTPKEASAPRLLDREPFEQVFGKKATRKKPTLDTYDLDEMVKNAESALAKWEEDQSLLTPVEEGVKDEQLEIVFKAGTSKRIWNELYKVIDSSDVLIQVLDARDPNGTRCKQVENYLKKEKSHKHLIFVLNKADLVPNWAIKKWVAILSAEHPTMAFRASITNCFGKGDLISLLRQFAKLHKDKKQISVGMIGYPNVGKSSIINALKSKKVCGVAPVPGETKVWQYVTLMNNIFLIDCPGVVYPTGATPTDMVLKGVVRVEKVKQPEDYVAAVLDRVKKDYIQKTYNLVNWESPEDFLEQLAKMSGRLLKGGEPDISTVAKNVLNDYQRGKVPYFVRPPESELEEENDDIPENAELLEAAANDGSLVDGSNDAAKENGDEESLAAGAEESMDKENESEDNNEEDSDEDEREMLDGDDNGEKTENTEVTEDITSESSSPDKKKRRKKENFIHPFFEQTSRKLGDINKKMAKLKQNLKEIQARKAEKQKKKLAMVEDAPQTVAQSDSDTTEKKAAAVKTNKKLPQYIHVPDTDLPSEKVHGGKKGRKRIFQRLADSLVPCSTATNMSPDGTVSSRKRKLDSGEDSASPVSAAKKGKVNSVTTVPTASGAMIVSDINDGPHPRLRPEGGAEDPATSVKKNPGAVKSTGKRRRIEKEQDESPRLKGLERRRMQRQEIKELNKKNEFYKDKDIKNRRQRKR
ncbi:nucleolar GTP-binding protein 2 isoform X2 [Aplysia californica]|uniref:Nucleolar GTP-binding protein 2 n=1 Tax=Aplysia californica TaxID=6500 RepID=A0ABM0ZXF5_APLCA|nr:nucleolar GTP-binding protein 2 isoform X2 [Aplysia californica]